MLVKATTRGQHPDGSIKEAGEVFEMPPDHIALVSEHTHGVGWMELVNEGDHQALINHRAAHPAKPRDPNIEPAHRTPTMTATHLQRDATLKDGTR